MKTIRDLVCFFMGLFVIGVAGGLEHGRITVVGAVVAWCVSAVIISIFILIERRTRHGN